MSRTDCVGEVARVNVLATVLQCICEALPADTAAQVSAAIMRANDATALAIPESEDAAQARVLAPLVAALRR